MWQSVRACATCHVYTDEGAALPPAEGMETDMLEFAREPKEASRIYCQITSTDDKDGIFRCAAGTIMMPTCSFEPHQIWQHG